MKFGLILFAITVVLYPTSQLLLKMGMNQVGGVNSVGQLFSFGLLFRVITNIYIISGVTLAVMNLVIWLGAISTLNISYLYPFGSISYIVLTVLAHFVLKESIAPIQWLGICVIMIGCFLINR